MKIGDVVIFFYNTFIVRRRYDSGTYGTPKVIFYNIHDSKEYHFRERSSFKVVNCELIKIIHG